MDSQLALDFGGSRPSDDSRGSDTPRPGSPAQRQAPALVHALARAAQANPTGRKILVGRARGEGRELLRSLARLQGGWIGFESTTLRPLAVEIAGAALVAQGRTLIDDFQVTARVDAAVDRVLSRRAGRFEELIEAVGFRRALEHAVLALRMAGLRPDIVRRTPFDDREKREMIAKVLEVYEADIGGRSEVDIAGLFSFATQQIEDGAPTPQDTDILMLPGLSARGHAGAFVHALRSRGARFLEDDPVVGVDAPPGVFAGLAAQPTHGSYLADPSAAPTEGPVLHIDLFAGTSVTAELREVLRRVLEQRLPWDQVEILTPDPRAYGSALHALAESLAVPVTFGVGLPVERSRPGRAITEYFRWIDSGFSADVIRGLLEAGDLRPANKFDWISPMDLTRRFRELRIGWGRARHERRLQRRIRSLERMEPSRRESQEQMERRRGRIAAELSALSSILTPVLVALPPGVPDPSQGPAKGTVSPAELARGAATFLDHVPLRDSVDETAAAELRRVLERIEESLTRSTDFRAAAAIVRRALQVKIPSPRSDGSAPWGSTPGHVYFTDLEYGGLANRPHTFVVGMDASRFPGSGTQDPLLLDREREKLSLVDLATSSALLHERAFAFNRAFARMRGAVAVSYATWEPSEARELSPSVEALATARLKERDPTLTFDGLRAVAGRPVGAIPHTRVPLDARDVWMAAIEDGGRLLDGRALVDGVFPGIARGSLALAAPAGERVSSFLGQVRPRPELDPRTHADTVLSASRLEHLGRCPRRYLYQGVLRLYPPDDPEYLPDRWLSPLARGDVLHRVFETTLRRGREEPEVALEVHANQSLDREVRRAIDLHPTPSLEIQQRERRMLEEDVRSFLQLVEEKGAQWEELELKFGFDNNPPATIQLYPQGTIRLRGAIDRVDTAADGHQAVVIDYKTGSAYTADRGTGLYDGGRRLQNVLYVMAYQDLHDRRVERMEYQYPTRRARNTVLEFEAEVLRSGPFLLGQMIEGAAAGHFLPTDSPDDCTWCDFQAICRVRKDGHTATSPPAEWTRRWLKRADDEPNALPPELRQLRDVRREDAPGILPPPLWSEDEQT